MDLKYPLSKLQVWATGVPLARHMQRFDKYEPLFAYGGLTGPRRASTTPATYLRGCRKHKAGF
jgi:hypothetical protein